MSLSGLFTDAFIRRALVEAILVGALCGLVGVQVVLRRLAFFTMSMTHATFPGVVLAALLGLPLLLGTGAFGVLVVLAIAGLWGRRRADASSVVGVVLSGGFALGVALLSAQAGFTRDLSAYLVGSILTVAPSDLAVSAGVLVAVAVVLAALGKELVLAAFDRRGLVAQGYPAALLDLVVLLLVEATIVAAVPSVGTILSVALVVAPAATARFWTDRIEVMTAVAVSVGVVSGVLGVVVSQLANVAAGGVTVLVATGLFALSWIVAPRRGAISRRNTRSVSSRPTAHPPDRRPARRRGGALRRRSG